MTEFDLEGRASVELNKLLKLTGLCPSGGAAKMAIAAGSVTVDGQLELRKRCKIRPGQVVAFAGQRIAVFASARSGVE
jgi:ribosome-associated protein